ncbi:prepilin-type N-terminal cleavage/methylation domain-containing protein [Propionispora hippei]|uniref:Prepilin-type N-terminal cleavage/methylation domain-containing protein n=1 Tax=Propionispora hippei DSM 15287 TaxID=1123003 RepID=A0A1M6AEJ0_9FIRM|nr:prepilin-type N-terminal cleavage/methylation domain-containing protein [Propionispora hippei]SHI34950.1 prepilin-type N-terminal cleavage/methylation domain-containing protein [Propionispora hippei DSM 15287]
MFRSQKGFALIELLVAIAILGILAGIAGINLRYGIAKNDLTTATSQLAADIRTMQQLSMEKAIDDTSAAINITFATGSYQIITDQSTNTGFSSRTLPSSITLSSSNGNTLAFNPSNLSTNTATMVTLTSSILPKTENKQTIIISRMTGRIRIDTSSTPAYRTEEI